MTRPTRTSLELGASDGPRRRCPVAARESRAHVKPPACEDSARGPWLARGGARVAVMADVSDRRGGTREVAEEGGSELRRESEARTALDADQTAADLDQTQADSDQMVGDADQAASDTDQGLANRDQHASDRDQAAADWESSHTGRGALAEQAHGASRIERESGRSSVLMPPRRSGQGRPASGWPRRPNGTRWPGCGISPPPSAIARPSRATGQTTPATGRPRRASAGPSRAAPSGTPSPRWEALRTLGWSIRQRAALERVAAANDATPRRRTADGLRRTAVTPAWTSDRRLSARDPRACPDPRDDRSRRSDRSLVLALIEVDGTWGSMTPRAIARALAIVPSATVKRILHLACPGLRALQAS